MRTIWVVLAALLAGCGGSTDRSDGKGGGSDRNSDVEDEICALALKLSCGEDEYASVDQCRLEFSQARVEAAEVGCTVEWDALVACLHAHPLVCSALGYLALDQVCEPARQTLTGCGGWFEGRCRSGYFVGEGTETCSFDCGSYSVQCSGAPGAFDCSCTTGPQLGTVFSAPDCQPPDEFATVCG